MLCTQILRTYFFIKLADFGRREIIGVRLLMRPSILLAHCQCVYLTIIPSIRPSVVKHVDFNTHFHDTFRYILVRVYS